MAHLFSIDNLLILFVLILLQAILGFDNLGYVSIESKNFVLLIVGAKLLSEGGHLDRIEFFGNTIEPMRKTTLPFCYYRVSNS